MSARFNIFKMAPKAMENMLKMEEYIRTETTIDPILYELIKTRVSQINGCAYCLDMHTKDALKLGETPQRLFLLPAWRETKLFTPKEKIALELSERLTEISMDEIDNDLYQEVLEHFSEKEFVDLVIIIAQINTWNRFNIAAASDYDKNYK